MNLSGGTTFKDWIASFISFVNIAVVPVIFALAMIVFIWGVVDYFFLRPASRASYSDRGGYGEGRQFILWGIVGIVVLFSVWGIVNLLLSTLGIARAT